MSEYDEAIDLTIEPWKSLASMCWNGPSPFRLGAKAERHGVKENPYKAPLSRALFEEGREMFRKNYPTSQTAQRRPQDDEAFDCEDQD